MGRVLFFYQKIFKNIVIAGCLFFLWSPVGMTASPETGVVAVDRLNLRQGPGISQPLVKVLERGDEVAVLSRSRGWIKVRHEGDVGYVSGRGNYIDFGSAAGGRKSPKLDAAAAKAEDLRRQIDQQSSELSAFTKQEKKLINRLDETDRALNDARRKTAVMEAEMKKLSADISDLGRKAKDVQQAIDESSEYAVKRLVALYKLDRLGEVNLLASAVTLNDLLHRKSALERILAHDSRVVADLAAEKKRLSGLMDRLAKRKEEQESLGREYQKTITALTAEKAEREQLLAEMKDRKTHRLAAIKYLKSAAREMDKTIEALRQDQAREQKKAEIRARKEAEKKAKLAAQEAARQKARVAAEAPSRQKKPPPAPAPEKTVAVAGDRFPARAKERKPVQAAPKAKPEPRAADDFSAHQGLLKMPVKGSIITRFGKYIEPQSGAVNFRNGIEIKTPQGTPIRAVFAGQTIYSSWLKGYGNVIIIAHGEHFHTVYAHVDEVFSAKGKAVEAGEVIATVGDSGSMNGPSLYFEIRHRGSPVDPLKWVNKS